MTELFLPEVPPDPTFTVPALTYERGRKFEHADFTPIVDGELIPPNLKPLEQAEFLSRLFWHSGSRSGYLRLERDRPGLAPYARPVAKFIFSHGQWGDLNGAGIIMARSGAARAIECFSFAFCEHVGEPDRGHDARRGHHFMHCKKCGFDMSVDSSD